VLLLAACSGGGSSEPIATSPIGVVAPDTEPSVVPLTQPPDVTPTVPAGTLFGGDPCTALVAADFSHTVIAREGTGNLTDSGALDADSCGYTVHAGSKDFTVTVEAITASEFAKPAVTVGATPDGSVPPRAEPLDGIGLAAKGIDLGATYQVVVQVKNGFFAVTAPDGASCRSLAAAAVRHAAG
jgi:hypothetical protein